MSAPGVRLHATGGRRPQPQFAVAFSSNGAGLVNLGRFGAERQSWPGIFRIKIAYVVTGRTLSQRVILVVDDDPLLNSLTINIFEDAGFVALAAGDADEAMAILESRSDISLLLTDINMPGSMDGLALAHAVRKRWPPIKIVIVSSQVPKSVLPAGSRFFRKPYFTDSIISEIRSLIDPAAVIRDPGDPIYRCA